MLVVAGTGGWFSGALTPLVERFHPTLSLLKPLTFYACNDSRYYPEHGVEVLQTDALTDYVATMTAQDSSICFSVEDEAALANLKLVWYSKEETPKSIEVIGITDDEQDTETTILWPKDKTFTVNALGGHNYSEFKIDAEEKYSKFRINYVAGASQNRLLLRAATAFFKSPVDSDFYDAVSDAHRISLTAPYGMGVAVTGAKTIDDLATELRQQESLHCGNYSYLLAYEIEDERDWTAIGAISKLNAAHTVVELEYDGKTYTADPTLGALYPCSYASMQEGKCDFSKALFSETYNPILWRYAGKNFFPGSEIKAKFSELEDFYNGYRKL